MEVTQCVVVILAGGSSVGLGIRAVLVVHKHPHDPRPRPVALRHLQRRQAQAILHPGIGPVFQQQFHNLRERLGR